MAKAIKETTLEKYRLVIDEYFVNRFNGVKAYQAIYPRSSYKAADKSFRTITEIPRIKEYLDQKHAEVRSELRTSHKGLLDELQRWAYSDITETLMLAPREVKSLPEEIRRLITKFKTTKRDIYDSEGTIIQTIETVELHFVSKEKAMEMIQKHVGFYDLDNTQKYTITLQSREERDKRIEELLKLRKNA